MAPPGGDHRQIPYTEGQGQWISILLGSARSPSTSNSPIQPSTSITSEHNQHRIHQPEEDRAERDLPSNVGLSGKMDT